MFSQWLFDRGRDGRCSFDEEHLENKVITLKELAEQIDGYYRVDFNYLVGSEYSYYSASDDATHYDHYGEHWQEIIARLLKCKDEALDIILNMLPNFETVDPGEEDTSMYDDGIKYESFNDTIDRKNREHFERMQSTNDFNWDQFCWQVKHQNRMFRLEKSLDKLFDGSPETLLEIGKGSTVFRARAFSDELRDKNPNDYLWAPPPSLATAGRMNHAFIPMFYGAFSEDCAIAEIQPFIGQTVAVGRFSFTRNITAFDFTIFDKIFEGKYSAVDSWNRYSIVRHLQELISQPVNPTEKYLEYLPTQFLTEYIRDRFKVDAIIFFSSLRPKAKENRNIAIFLENEDITLEAWDDRILTLGDRKPVFKKVDSIQYNFSTVECPF
jgi:hypothetical protein